MKRAIAVLAVLVLLTSVDLLAQAKKKEIPRMPPIMWEVRAGRSKMYLIPYDAVSPTGHKKIREQIPGYVFFFVIVDNKSKEDLQFKYGGGDIVFRNQQGGQFGNVNLRNTFKDPSQASKISPELRAMLKDITVKPAKKDWTLVCFREALRLDDIRSVMWTVPGEMMPQDITNKRKPANLSYIKRLKIDYIK